MDRATKFAQDVLAGFTLTEPIIAGELEILACKRHINDLARQGTEEFPYVWSEDKANEIMDFAENLTLAEGEEPQPLVLRDFQCFMFGSWNGWVHKDTEYRRFRTSYIQLARQNGKSLGNAVPSLYYGNFDGYNYPQLYATATKEAQARIVLKECIKFIDADKELSGTKTKKGFFTIKDYKSEIECNISRGTIKALGRDTKSIDGFRPYFASVDEYHLHKDNQMYKLLSDGTKKLKQCLISVITTAGFDLNSPCYKLYEYCCKILKGVVEDETQFVFITQLDKNDDIWDEENWPKANPLWTPETLTNLRADAIKAREMGGEELRNFMTKSLNIWVQMSDYDYINIDRLKECGSVMTIEDMAGKSCYVGLDLSKGGDLTSMALEFPLEIDDKRKYFIYQHSFIPRLRMQEHVMADRAPYDMWNKEGLLTVTPGVKTDYQFIIKYLKEIKEQYNLKFRMICYDPYNAETFLSDLQQFGCDCLEIWQNPKSLSSAIEDFSLEVDEGNVIYNKKDGLLVWSIVNAKVESNAQGYISIIKERTTARIDVVDAIIDAHKMAMRNEEISIDISKYATDDFLSKLWG